MLLLGIMKKILTFVTAALLALTFISCGKKIDTSTWLSNMEDAKTAAKAENKKIFLFFSDDEGDEKSAKLKQNLFNTEDFIKTYTENYVLVNLDFSNSRFDSDQEHLKQDYRHFDLYAVQGTPYFLILSAEGYVITKIAFEADADIETARLTFGEVADTIESFEEKLAKTKSGSKEERMKAINDIVDGTDPAISYHLAPLNELYISLDKNNESGESLKHLIALTYAKATDYFLEGEPEKGSDEFAKIVDNKILSEEDKQMAWYTAGFLLTQSGSRNYAKIKEYYQNAYDIAPESELGNSLKATMNYLQMLIDGEGDDGISYEPQGKDESEENSSDNSIE